MCIYLNSGNSTGKMNSKNGNHQNITNLTPNIIKAGIDGNF